MSTLRLTRVATRARAAVALLAGALALAACSPDTVSSPTVHPAFPAGDDTVEHTNEFDRRLDDEPAARPDARPDSAAVRATPDA